MPSGVSTQRAEVVELLCDEVTFAADCVWRLVERRAMKSDAKTMRSACTALGLTVDDVRLASIRAGRRKWRNVRPGMTLRETPAVEPDRTSPYARKKTGPRPRERNHQVIGEVEHKWCPRHDDGTGAMVPTSEFKVKDHRMGSLTFACAACVRRYQQERYLTVAKAKTVEAATAVLLSFALRPDDAAIGARCPVCTVQLDVGDEVSGETVLTHTECAG